MARAESLARHALVYLCRDCLTSYASAGVLILVLLNMSNPFLHVAKVAHYMEL